MPNCAGPAWLQADLDSGAWQARYGRLMDQDAIDGGHRLVASGAEAINDV